jgi:zinc transport system substrate-binding protein
MTMIVVSVTVSRMHRTSAAIVVAALALTGCAAKPAKTTGGRLRVEAAFYPVAFLVDRIGGDLVAVDDLTPAGAEPHDLELRASQVGAVRSADITVYLKGFQSALDQAVEGAKTLDLTVAVPLENHDPHVWLDPVRMATMAGEVARRLAELSPAHASEIEARGRALRDELGALDGEYRRALARCDRQEVVTSHEAFGYLARRYGLTQVGIAGLSPDEEPTAKRLAEVARIVRDKHVTTVFFETLVSPKLARTVARETGAKAAVLDPIEGVEKGHDYLSVMRSNLAALVAALGCR